MSKINLEALKKAAFSKQNSEDDEKAKRIAACKQKEKEKLDSLILKYFNSDWSYSINNSLMRACEKSSGETNSIELYMNFDRNDFSGWHAFVPFKADQHGMNYNARPVNCIRRFLEYAQEVDMLPGNITFDCWANYKCTVVFTILFEGEEEDTNIDESAESSEFAENSESDANVPKNASKKYRSWAQTVSAAGSSTSHAKAN